MRTDEIYSVAEAFCHIESPQHLMSLIITIQNMTESDRQIFLENVAGRIRVYREMAIGKYPKTPYDTGHSE